MNNNNKNNNPFDEIDDNDVLFHSPREEQQQQLSHKTAPTCEDDAFALEGSNGLLHPGGEAHDMKKSNGCEREHLLKNATISFEE